MKTKKTVNGVTLIEIILCVAIVGLLAVTLMAAFIDHCNAENSNYTISIATSDGTKNYYTDEIEYLDGGRVTFVDKNTGNRVTLANYIIEEKQ